MVRRWVPALVLGGVWWWAVLRLLLEPERAGLVEGAVAAGGWGLSLLPVHVAASARPTGTIGADGDTAGWFEVGIRRADSARRTAGAWGATGARLTAEVWRTTRAWRRRRSGGGSGRS
ncbi:hypothetical protein [Streptomyces sp. 061-3]|uniref:hypothetical protein n=1 Tax=Streptomyces sp. 061-3 TaxID=2789268 RepID=UPI003981930C